jgi:hypothetical protein
MAVMSVAREINGPTLEVSVLYDEYTIQIRVQGALARPAAHFLLALTPSAAILYDK